MGITSRKSGNVCPKPHVSSASRSFSIIRGGPSCRVSNIDHMPIPNPNSSIMRPSQKENRASTKRCRDIQVNAMMIQIGRHPATRRSIENLSPPEALSGYEAAFFNLQRTRLSALRIQLPTEDNQRIARRISLSYA